MKNLLTTLLLCTVVIITNAQTTHFDSLYYKDNAYQFNDSVKITRDNIFTTYKNQFGLGTNDSMGIEQTQADEYGFHTKYNQYYKGYKIQNADMNVIGRHGVIIYANGNPVKNLNITVTNPIAESVALDSALKYISAELYSWQDTTRENNLKESLDDSTSTFSSYPIGKKIIINKNITDSTTDSYALTWKFIIETLEPQNNITIYVDALTGVVVYTRNESNEYQYGNDGKLWTWYDGYYDFGFRTRTCNGCNYRLSDQFISTHSRDGDLYSDNNDNWIENYHSPFSQRKTAHTAQWIVEQAWDYYSNVHGKIGSDGNYKRIRIWPRNFKGVALYAENGQFDDLIKLRADNLDIPEPDANNLGTGYSVAALDVISHEYTHAFIHRSTDLNNYGDAGALSEGISDIFGIMVERYVKGYTDWSIGEKIGLVRYFSDPSADYHLGGPYANIYEHDYSPSTYLTDTYWLTSLYNNGNVPTGADEDLTMHRNSGVLRKWFYLLAEGGTFPTVNGVTVQGIGIDKAQQILYISFNWWFWGNLRYSEAAKQIALAAKYHYGKCSQEHRSVIKAWEAVGINILLNCYPIVIDGPGVINISDVGSSSSTIPRFKTILDGSSTIDNSKLTWIVPSTWSTTVENGELKLNSASNYNTQLLVAKYKMLDDAFVYDSMYVHFSNDVVISDLQSPQTTAQRSIFENNKEPEIAIYPNPSNTVLNIEVPYINDNGTVTIFDIQGKLIYKKILSNQYLSINTSTFNEGLYIVKYTSNNISITQKIIIRH